MSERRPHSEEELVELVRALDARAPAALHERLELLAHERSSAARGARRRAWLARPLPLGSAAAALAALAVVLVLVLGSGSGARGPSPLLRAAVDVSSSSPAGAPAPAQSASRPGQLDAAVDGIHFPYWRDELGWSASAIRSATLAGRPATTVYYTAAGGRRVGYTILGGAPLGGLSDGSRVWRDGALFHIIEIGGVRAVAWLQHGHLCVIAGAGARDDTLLRLATSA